ncbi:MAG: helix-turn-helix transcriptional regulator [Vampirovibrionales bacterium]|nr:helix-turn-helix transcriptional regulator [Vampirovibrionales bacterium]
MLHLSRKLRELRGERSLLDIEKGTRISRVQIMRFEKAQRVPNPTNLRQLAEFFNTSYDSLRSLYYEDLFQNKDEQRIVLKWAKKHLESGLLEKLESEPTHSPIN